MDEVMWYRLSLTDDVQMMFIVKALTKLEAAGWTEFHSTVENDIVTIHAREAV